MRDLPAGWRFIGHGWAAEPDVIWTNPDYAAAAQCARGRYQESLLQGEEAWSGSTLTGKAAKFGGKYASSRRVLKAKMRDAGVQFSIQTINRRQVLCLGDFPHPPAEVIAVPEFSGVINNIADFLEAP